MEKITYASLGSLGDNFHREFDTALNQLRHKLGATHLMLIAGAKKKSSKGTFADLNPANTKQVIGHFQSGSRADTAKAIQAAREAYPDWRGLGWAQRIAFLRAAADDIARHQFKYAAILTLEAGKTRTEAIAEVSEAADLLLYYSRQMELHGGFTQPMGGTGLEQTRSLLRPYGVWAVIAPFNFPFALAAGMAAGALVAGNTVVVKPASDTPLAGLCLHEVFHNAGLPVGIVNVVTGPGPEVGEELVTNPSVDGLIFTGSRAVGMEILRRFTTNVPRPCIAEMGGKNPVIVMPTANLEDATEGVLRSAFGYGGQKCSACSRAYVHKAIYAPFMEMLVEKTMRLKIGDPAQRDVFLGPLINAAAVERFRKATQRARREGRVVIGGGAPKDAAFEHGHFVEPTIVDRVPQNSPLFHDEFFAPFLAVAEIKSLDDGIALANDSEYGLTAGIFSELAGEQDEFFARIEAGVTYSNRRGGATTGAWPGVQSFGGWKCSGSSGKGALGPYYVQQFLREQSQTVVRRPAPPKP
jgi:1-pyrroline-5-carboxylate dehydrogenase